MLDAPSLIDHPPQLPDGVLIDRNLLLCSLSPLLLLLLAHPLGALISHALSCR